MKPLTIIDAMSDPELFGKDFTSCGWRRSVDPVRGWDTSGSWDAWKAFLATAYNIPVSVPRAEVVRTCTGLAAAPGEPIREAFDRRPLTTVVGTTR